MDRPGHATSADQQSFAALYSRLFEPHLESRYASSSQLTAPWCSRVQVPRLPEAKSRMVPTEQWYSFQVPFTVVSPWKKMNRSYVVLAFCAVTVTVCVSDRV